MLKKIFFIIFFTTILVLVRNSSIQKTEFIPSPKQYDTLVIDVIRVVENKPVAMYSKMDTSSSKIAQLKPGDSIVISAITKDWCKVSSKKQEGYSYEKLLKSYSSPHGTPKWKIWLKHNYKGDKWKFWVLNIILLGTLIFLLPAFLAFESTFLKTDVNSVINQSRNKLIRFLLETFVPDFRSFYKICIASGILIIGVAIFDNNAFLSMIQYKLPYLFNESHIYGLVLFVIIAFTSLWMLFEIAGSFLYYGYSKGGIRTIALIISSAIIIVLTIALFMPVLIVLTTLFLLSALAKVDPVKLFSNSSSPKEETYLATCPACGGTGKKGDGLFAGCGMCSSTGKVKYNRNGQYKGSLYYDA